jgi:hypothetical protein
MAEQKQFDWLNEKSKCVEGIKLPVGEDRKFELVHEEVSLHNLVRADGTTVTNKQGVESRMWTIPFRDVEANVKIKLDYFWNEKERVNPANPELESEIVKLSRKLGYEPVVDGDFAPSDFLKPGMTIIAQLKEQPPNKNGRVYNTIDIDTVRLDGAGETEKQDVLDDVSDETAKEILAIGKGCKKFSELTTKINKAKKYELLQGAMVLNEKGKLKFPM